MGGAHKGGMARLSYASRRGRAGRWKLHADRHQVAAGHARMLMRTGNSICVLDFLVYTSGSRGDDHSITHWLPLVSEEVLDTIDMNAKFEENKKTSKASTAKGTLELGEIELDEDVVAAAAQLMQDWRELADERGLLARAWISLIALPANIKAELFGGSDAWVQAELITRTKASRTPGMQLLLEKSFADAGVTLGNELVPVTSPEKAIPVELKVLTSESNGYWDTVQLKQAEGGFTINMLLRPAPAGGGQHLVLVVQLVGKVPMSPAIVAQELKSLLHYAVLYATGGYELRTLESIEDLPFPVPTVDDPESGPLYVLVKEEGCEEPQPWQVHGDAWVRGVPKRLDVGKLKYLNPRMLCRCAINGMPGSWYIEAGEQAAADDALVTAVREASSASWDELSSIAELQTANGNSRNTHNEGLLAIAAKLFDAGLLVLGNFVSEVKEHIGVRVNGKLLTVCTAASTSARLEFSTDRGSHGRVPLSLGFAPSLLIVTFSGAVLENQAWERGRSAGGMLVPDEATAEEVVGAERRSTPLERVVAVLPLDPAVWAPHTAPPKQWHMYAGTLVRQFARFAGMPAPLLHSCSKPPAAGSLDAFAVDVLCAGIGTIDNLPTLVELCANAKAFKQKIATVKAF